MRVLFLVSEVPLYRGGRSFKERERERERLRVSEFRVVEDLESFTDLEDFGFRFYENFGFGAQGLGFMVHGVLAHQYLRQRNHPS